MESEAVKRYVEASEAEHHAFVALNRCSLGSHDFRLAQRIWQEAMRATDIARAEVLCGGPLPPAAAQ